jgi:serine/threonine protein phosphatase PrpC
MFGLVPWFDSDKRWVQMPPDGNARDFHAEFGLFDDLAIFSASLRGRKHRLLGKANEDAFWVRYVASDRANYLVVALCDGLSSAEFSDEISRWTAARVSQRVAVGLLALKEISEKSIVDVISSAVLMAQDDLLKRKITSKTGDPANLATTLTVAAIPSKDFDAPAVFAYIGDSPSFLRDEETWVQISLQETEKEVQTSATDAFPIIAKCRFVTPSLRSGDVILMTSDGIGNYIARHGRNLQLGEYLLRRWEKPRDEIELLADLSFDLRSADDDRTAIAVWMGV